MIALLLDGDAADVADSPCGIGLRINRDRNFFAIMSSDGGRMPLFSRRLSKVDYLSLFSKSSHTVSLVYFLPTICLSMGDDEKMNPAIQFSLFNGQDGTVCTRNEIQ